LGDFDDAKRHGELWGFRRRWRRNGGGLSENDGDFAARDTFATRHGTRPPRNITNAPPAPRTIPNGRAIRNLQRTPTKKKTDTMSVFFLAQILQNPIVFLKKSNQKIINKKTSLL